MAAKLDAALADRRGEPSGLVRVATSAVIGRCLLPALGPRLDAHVQRVRHPIDAARLPERQRLPKVRAVFEARAAWFARL